MKLVPLAHAAAARNILLEALTRICILDQIWTPKTFEVIDPSYFESLARLSRQISLYGVKLVVFTSTAC